jgi:hypothetical protein
MIKKYQQFINESNEDPQSDSDISKESKYSEVKDEIKTLIDNTIENSGGEFKSFVESYIKSSEDVKIEGLINESDIYEFYLKFRNDIDEVLNDSKFFDESPSDISTFGLYDYMIKGTQRAILELAKDL